MADVSASTLRAIRQIESGGNPNATTGSYKGLYQLSDSEFARYGGKGSIYDPAENERIASMKLGDEARRVSQKLGRDLQPWEQYLVHQQGEGGAYAHLTNPDRPAWQSMLSTGEGQQKGEGWARKAIWGNVPDKYKAQFGSVDNITSAQFAEMWRNRFARAEGQPGVDAINVAAGTKPSAPGALTTSYAPTEKPTMPALSADNTLGPGALNQDAQGGGLLGLNVSDNTYDGLMGIASALAGISNPDQAKALIAQQAANKRVAGDTGTWSIHTFPNGQAVMMNSKGRMMPLPGNYAKAEKDAYTEQYDTKNAEDSIKLNKELSDAAGAAVAQQADFSNLDKALKNPNVGQGLFGPARNFLNKAYVGLGIGDAATAQAASDADILNATGPKMALQVVQNGGQKLLPGSMSDGDLKLVQKFGAGEKLEPEANRKLLEAAILHNKRVLEAEQLRQEAITANGGRLPADFRSQMGNLQQKWAAENKARDEAYQPKPAEPAQAPKTNTFTSPSGKKINWSY